MTRMSYIAKHLEWLSPFFALNEAFTQMIGTFKDSLRRCEKRLGIVPVDSSGRQFLVSRSNISL